VRALTLRYKPLPLTPGLPSNGLPIGDLSDYSTLLTSLQRLRYTILSYRNDRVQINRLPVEILMLIWKLTLPADMQLTKPDNKRIFCIVKLTHVCRRWRLVLISSPALWTNFHVVKAAPKFVAECLQRSGKLPLHVSFKWDSDDPDYDSPSTSVFDDDGSVADDDGDAVDDNGSAVGDVTSRASSSQSDDSDDGAASHSTLSVYPDHRDTGYSWAAYIKEAQSYHHLMRHTHRIVTLDISLPPPGDDEDEEEGEEEDNPFACGLLFYPFPSLQTLKLRCCQEGQGSIPKVILDDHISVVEDLLLEHILPTQIMDLSLNITSLNLTTTVRDTPINTGQFLQFLGGNNNLRSLTLHNYKFHTFPDPGAPVALNNLRQLDVFSESATFLRYLVAPPLGPQSFLRMEKAGRTLSVEAKNGTAGTSTSVSILTTNSHPVADELLSALSEVFGSGWEEVTHVVVLTPIGGWGEEFADRFLDRLTRVDDLSVESKDDCTHTWLNSLAASKERCPKLRRVRLDIAPEDFPKALRSVRKLVKLRAEDGIPLEAVEQTNLSAPAVDIWEGLYNRWRIEDYLAKRDS